MSDLKPCMFCGSKGRVQSFRDDQWRVLCTNSCCCFGTDIKSSKERAIKFWNNRIEPPKPTSE